MSRAHIVCLFVFLLNLAACLDPDPCVGARAMDFQECLAQFVSDTDGDADTDSDSDTDTDADTDTVTVETGGTDPPDTTETAVPETGDTAPNIETGQLPVETGDTGLEPVDTGPEPIDTGIDDSLIDHDGDGLAEVAGDCDDTEPQVRAGLAEICDGLDNDCDTTVDDGVLLTFYEDADGDLFGNEFGLTEQACEPSNGYVAAIGDCNDTDDTIYPGAFEPCAAGPDYNCDGSAAFDDTDSDGWISCAECDDGNGLVYPGAYEFCDELDNNCDGDIDEGVQFEWHPDLDGDQYGNPNVTVLGCTAPPNFIADDTDCNDSQLAINPDASEVCDDGDVDEDCDGDADDLDSNVPFKTLWLQDADGDGFANQFVDTRTCDNPPLDYIVADSNGDGDEGNDPRDCNDQRIDIYPGAPVGVCDTAGDTGAPTDFDCDGSPDCP